MIERVITIDTSLPVVQSQIMKERYRINKEEEKRKRRVLVS